MRHCSTGRCRDCLRRAEATRRASIDAQPQLPFTAAWERPTGPADGSGLERAGIPYNGPARSGLFDGPLRKVYMKPWGRKG